MSRWRNQYLAVGLAALALAAAGCSSNSSSPVATSPSASASASASSSSASSLSGTPVNLGMANLVNATVSFPEASAAAQAAVDYVNAHGGVSGHPLKLTVCDLLLTPESDTACANQFAAAQPVAVLAGAVDAPSLIVPTLTKAKIPWITATPTDPTEYNDPYAFGVTGGSVASMSSYALYAKANGYKALSFVTNQNPSAVTLDNAIGKPAFAASGVTFNPVLFAPTAIDLTPTMSEASRGNAGGIIFQSSAPLCISAVRAAQQLGVKQPIVIGSACATNGFFAGVGAAWGANDLVEGNFGEKAGDPDTVLYQAAMAQYAPSSVTNGFAPAAFASVMDFAAAMKAAKVTTITSATVPKAMAAAKNVPSFLTLGSTFTCGGSLLSKYTSICSAEAFYYKQSSDGVITPVKEYDAAAVLNRIGS